MPRPQRKAAIDAKEKLKTSDVAPKEAEDGLGQLENEYEPRTGANARGGAAGAAKAGIDNKKQPARAAFKKTAEKAKRAAEPKAKVEGMEEGSEERSGDQPPAEDDANTAPVPERVSERRASSGARVTTFVNPSRFSRVLR